MGHLVPLLPGLLRLPESDRTANHGATASKPSLDNYYPNGIMARFEQAITFRLANGLRYTPDWAVFCESDQSFFGHLILYKVKGKKAWTIPLPNSKWQPPYILIFTGICATNLTAPGERQLLCFRSF